MPLDFEPILNHTNRIIGNGGSANNPGIYIWGIAMPNYNEIKDIVDLVNNLTEEEVVFYDINQEKNIDIKEGEIFCPLNVGETKKKISGRIDTHYTTEAFDKAVLFDLTLSITNLYAGLRLYNMHWLHVAHNIAHLTGLHHSIGSSLLFFSNPHFFEQLFPGIVLPPPFLSIPNVSQGCVMVSLPNTFKGVMDFKRKLLISQIILKRYFRFTYAICNGPLKEYEAATKWALEQMSIFTFAHVHGAGNNIYTALNAGGTPLHDVIDFHYNLNGIIYNPLPAPLNYNV